MRHLISKLIAAAISAAVVLLWWPIIMSTDGPESWALRAVAWTLLFECVLALLAPIEDSLWERFDSAKRIAAKVSNTKHRVYSDEHAGPHQLASRIAVVALVAVIPLGLIAGGPAPAKPKPTIVKKQGTTKVIRITKVIRVNQYGEPIAPTATTIAPVKSKKKTVQKKPAVKKSPPKHVAAKPVVQPTEPVAAPETTTPQAETPSSG
jgi:hypothetical protein